MQMIKLGDIIKLQRGFDLPSKNRESGEIPVISSSGINGWHNVPKIDGPNVITGRSGTIGEVFYYSKNCWPLNTTLFVKDFKGNDPKYIYYLLTYVMKSLVVTIGKDKSTVPSLDRNVLHQIYVPYINGVEEQKKMVEILNLIDESVNNNKKILQSLDGLLQLLFQRWFFQFEFPGKNGKPYLTHAGKMKWDPKLQINIPSGWNSENLFDNSLFTIISPGVEYFTEKEYISTSEVNDLDVIKGIDISYENRESRANMQPSLYSVWFARMKNSIKHLFFSNSSSEQISRFVLSTGFCGFQCQDVSFEFITALIRTSWFEEVKDANSNGATQQAITNADLKNIYIAIPDNETLLNFHENTKEIVEQMNSTMNEINVLHNLKKWLLPMLINGQVTIK